MITSAGVGSGLDIESIISQLMTLEREPINDIAAKQNEITANISAVGNLRSILDQLQTSAEAISDDEVFGGLLASSSDEEVFTVSSTSGSQPSNHTVEVLSLARAHRLSSELYPEGGDSTIGNGTYDFSSGDNSFTIELDSSNNTLDGLREAINNSSDNTSIRASLLNLDGGSRLVLSAINSGTENAIIAPSQFSDVTTAADASLIIDGFEVSSSSNAVTDVIPGVTVNLLTTGTSIIETATDTESYQTVLETFATNYNNLVDAIDVLGQQQFRGDGTLRSIATDLSKIFYDPVDVDGESHSLVGLGLTFDRTGTLTVDQSQLDDALKTNSSAFLAAMTDSTDGLATRVVTAIERYTASDGLLSNKEDALESRMSILDLQTERLEYRAEQVEQRYRRQFSALDVLVSQLQTTSSFLTQQLESLNSPSDS